METGKLPAETHYACREIAAERDQLRARVAELEAVLQPFAAVAEGYDPPENDDHLHIWCDEDKPTLGQLRRARAALEGKGDE